MQGRVQAYIRDNIYILSLPISLSPVIVARASGCVHRLLAGDCCAVLRAVNALVRLHAVDNRKVLGGWVCCGQTS